MAIAICEVHFIHIFCILVVQQIFAYWYYFSLVWFGATAKYSLYPFNEAKLASLRNYQLLAHFFVLWRHGFYYLKFKWQSEWINDLKEERKKKLYTQTDSFFPLCIHFAVTAFLQSLNTILAVVIASWIINWLNVRNRVYGTLMETEKQFQ